MFADDTNVFFSNKEARVIETVINTELKQNGDMVQMEQTFPKCKENKTSDVVYYLPPMKY